MRSDRLAPFALVMALICAGDLATFAPRARAQSDYYEGTPRLVTPRAMASRAHLARRLGTAGIAGPGDTTWVGHTLASTFNYGPYHIGKGPGTPGASTDGVWDWDHWNAGENDSLQGWWPFRRTYALNGGLTMSDDQRPWWCLDYGNMGNYVLSSQHQARTFGVLSYWHVDGGSNAPGPGGSVSWAPISGSGSAWCGLRIDGDNAYVDPVTGNAYNSQVLMTQGEGGGGSSSGAVGTYKHFPGYTSQMDQLLYRDVTIADGATLSLSFNYRTAMSTTTDQTASTRAGWFQYDPSVVGKVQVAGPNFNAPNFISNTGINQPADSFMVYVGVPVDIDNVYTADGTLHQPNLPAPGPPHGVYDLYRRWFSEVLALDKPIVQLASIGGTRAVTAFSISALDLSAIAAAQAGPAKYARIVFRVKTNAIASDLTGSATGAYQSGGEGAVRIDDVSIGGAGITVNSGVGDSPNPEGFESQGDINNTIEPGGLALSHWHATGKPPATYFHTHPLPGGDIGGGNVYAPLTYNDLCGPPGAASVRFCNMSGVVISAGDHDHGEAAGGLVPGMPERERADAILSPVINLCTSGAGDYNGQGIDYVIAKVSDDYELRYDIYAGIFNLNFTGNYWTYGIQAYPGRESNGYGNVKVWGNLRIGPLIFNPSVQCFTDIEPYYANGIAIPIVGDATSKPDSLRAFLGKIQECFRFGVTTSCSSNQGAYFDNVSFGFSNAAETQVSGSILTVDPWAWISDAFPFNATPGLPGTSAFDTCAAFIKSGVNLAQDTNDANRFDIPGDSTVAIGSTDNPARMDLVFRVKPGPGDYHIIGNRSSGLRPVPTDGTNLVAVGDLSWWGQYLRNNGAFGTGGSKTDAGGGPGHPGGVWSENIWNSARCDSVEVNLFGFNTAGNLAAPAGRWEACYHESDPKYATLGIPHNLCFLNNPAGSINSTNITCTSVPSWATAGAGYNGSQTSKENTKILPDGLFTPGTHVEYFWRECELGNVDNFVMSPDTHFVSPQLSEGSVDGHRWQEFSVLPDRWKEPTFGDPTAHGMACMLYVDLNDRRGDERVWVSVADSIGLTTPDKWGAHNGWRARKDQQYTDAAGNPIDVSGDPTIAVYTHGGSPGTTWDMYGVKDAEALAATAGGIGSRLAPLATGLAAGKDARTGPTLEMLRAYYRLLLLLSGDLNSEVLGPFINRGQDDVGMLKSWLTSGTATRVLYAGGDGFVQSEYATGLTFTSHADLLNNVLGVTIRQVGGSPAYSYQAAASDFSDYVDLVTSGPIAGDIYSVGNACLWGNDVLAIPISGPTASGYYGGSGPNAPFISGVLYSRSAPSFNYETVVDGFDIQHVFGRSGGSSTGRLGYFFRLLTSLNGALSCNLFAGDPPISLDVPGGDAKKYVDFMALLGNPLFSGSPTIRLGLAHADRVQVRVYDVAGRCVRKLADRTFTAGQHDLVWDGASDAGVQLPRGVYFTQAHYAKSGFTEAKKLTILK